MLNHDQLKNHLDDILITTIKTNKGIEYLNIESGFDIETSSSELNQTKVAFMYIWMFGIGLSHPIYYGRTWSEFLDVCKLLQSHFKLSDKKRLVVYIHNLGYEFQFMRKYFKWDQIFSTGERKPIKALCTYGIEFRDSYILSGYSLENTAKNLNTHKVKKLVGDLDYSLVRTHKTPLTKKELAYCKNDIEIILAYINEQIQQYKDVSKIPMTNTGRVRRYVRDRCYYNNTNHRKSSRGKYDRYRAIMNDLTIDPEVYQQLKSTFMGGFTHANAMYSGATLEKVSSIDFTSSYPSVMVAEKFPMSRFLEVYITTIEELEKQCKIYAMLFTAKFINIKPKIQHENYISESKCTRLSNPSINNGRVSSADMLIINLTEVDFDIIKNCYEWEGLEIANVKRANKNYLPKAIIESILNLYQDKTVLKDVEGSEVEYLLSKGMLNSVYGMSVTDPVMDQTIYDDDNWSIEPPNIEEAIEKYNSSRNRFLYYAWGIWVTAYARRNLWSGILAIGNDYIYSDTDSLKLLNYEEHKPYINWFNQNIIEKMEKTCDYYKFDKNLLHPKTKKGEVKTLGIWDFEGTYDHFKTLGAKRYLIDHKGKLQLTVAGLSKQNGINYMLKVNNGDILKVFEMFNDSLYIPSHETGKMTHTYIDSSLEFEIKDYLGELAYIETRSGVHLESCEFTLSVSRQYSEFLRNFKNGYIYRGVKMI